MHEAPPAKHFKSSACWPRYILSWTFLVDLYIGHWNFNIFAPTGWLFETFLYSWPFRDLFWWEGKPVFRSVLVLSWFSQEHSFLAQWRKPPMSWLCLRAPLSVVRWYDMVGLVWVTKSFRTILWRWYLYHSCIVWSGCQESDQTLQRTSVQCLHSIASTRVLVRVRVVTQQRSESEFKPDLQMSLWSFGHQLISIISINTLKLSLLRAHIQKSRSLVSVKYFASFAKLLAENAEPIMCIWRLHCQFYNRLVQVLSKNSAYLFPFGIFGWILQMECRTAKWGKQEVEIPTITSLSFKKKEKKRDFFLFLYQPIKYAVDTLFVSWENENLISTYCIFITKWYKRN